MIKRVLLCLYGNRQHQPTIDAAIKFAMAHDAELVSCIVDSAEAALEYAGSAAMAVSISIEDDRREALRSEYEALTRSVNGLRATWYEHAPGSSLPQPMMYTDIVFISQPNFKQAAGNAIGIIDKLIIDAGIPIVVIPNDWSGSTVGTKPVLGWKESKQAVSVVRHTLSLMRQSEDLDIVAVTKKPNRTKELEGGMEIGKYLAAHGIKCQYFERRFGGQDKTKTDVLLRHASLCDRDLIIVGGYSQSRYKEMLVGGMTRDLIKNANLPVLLAH